MTNYKKATAETSDTAALYLVRSEDACDTTIRAESMEAAKEWGESWLSDGDWGTEPTYVTGSVTLLDEDGDETEESEEIEIELNTEADEPDCAEGQEHEWETPHEIVGGCDSNPGVWSLGGSRISSKSVCLHCGAYQLYKSETTPGQYPRTPECTTYEEADERSLAWVKEMAE